MRIGLSQSFSFWQMHLSRCCFIRSQEFYFQHVQYYISLQNKTQLLFGLNVWQNLCICMGDKFKLTEEDVDIIVLQCHKYIYAFTKVYIHSQHIAAGRPPRVEAINILLLPLPRLCKAIMVCPFPRLV